MTMSFRHFCGPKCANCCMVLSVWGILFLMALGGLFYVKSSVLIHDAVNNTEEDMEAIAMNCWYAGIGYIITFFLSIWQKKENERKAAQAVYSSVD
eukprot:m.152122 g.152122  ORF g.152122 m.152122 type:complete len:96 (-) comp30793_c0_seq1:128-415(-)